jgi:hypothetical protein
VPREALPNDSVTGESFSNATVGVDCDKLRPRFYSNVVQYDIRFRKEAGKTISNAELLCTVASIFGSAGTPTVKDSTLLPQKPYMLNNCWYWYSFRTCNPDKGVVDIDINVERA